MFVSVAQAAEVLQLSPGRVQQLLRSGRLHGQRLGRDWLVDPDALAVLAQQQRPAGRPMAPARAWGLLDLLDGGSAPWLSSVARSQVRQQLRKLEQAPASRWRAALAGRNRVEKVWLHPAALAHLGEEASAALVAGVARAVQAGADLVLSDSPAEVYVPSLKDWDRLARKWKARPEPREPNLVVRIPIGVWPFPDGDVGRAALAADLLESVDPRAEQAGLGLLRIAMNTATNG